MTDQHEVVVVRWALAAEEGLAALLAAYHLRTEAEKGMAVADVAGLPDRYRAAETGVDSVRLSVWEWRTEAVSLYERFGFTVAQAWDEREKMVCMERAM